MRLRCEIRSSEPEGVCHQAVPATVAYNVTDLVGREEGFAFDLALVVDVRAQKTPWVERDAWLWKLGWITANSDDEIEEDGADLAIACVVVHLCAVG